MSKGIPGIPQAVFDHASPALEKIKNSAEGSGRLPVWEGELYLEYHRGTYTSHILYAQMSLPKLVPQSPR